MAHIALWICACLLTAWLLRARPIHAIALALVLWVCVPAVAGHHLTGLTAGSLAYHPATWLVFSVLVVQLVVNPEPLGNAVGKHVYVALSTGIFIVGAFVTSRLQSSGGTRLLMDQIVSPAVLFLIVIAYARDLGKLLLLRNVIVAVSAVEAALAIIQFRLQRIVFYESDYLKLYWFHPERFNRWMGTTEGPLVLSLLLCVAASLALSLRSGLLKFPLLILFLIGTFVTQSRTGALIMGLIIVYSIVRARTVAWKRVLTLVVIVSASYVLATSHFAQGLATRLSNDTGSANARVQALRFLYSNWSNFSVLGDGLTSSFDVARDAGLETSLESSYFMYVIDTGVILATLYFGSQLCLLIANGRQRQLPGATLAAAVACLLQHTFSSVGGSNLTGSIIWCALAIIVTARHLDDAPDRARLQREAEARTRVVADRGAVQRPQVVSR